MNILVLLIIINFVFSIIATITHSTLFNNLRFITNYFIITCSINMALNNSIGYLLITVIWFNNLYIAYKSMIPEEIYTLEELYCLCSMRNKLINDLKEFEKNENKK